MQADVHVLVFYAPKLQFQREFTHTSSIAITINGDSLIFNFISMADCGLFLNEKSILSSVVHAIKCAQSIDFQGIFNVNT